ncbi:MAG: arsenosugar biosynthesis radical SAM protein ArsS [Gammaproteobacteria bacterium]|nr:arsenosugar biosynthesis radical SAM protein ArsS [Gammaproteobacteria bacterium]
MRAMLPLLQATDFPKIRRQSLQTLQVNLGYRCNQACFHCHVNAGPTRTEAMDSDTINTVLRFIEQHNITTLDITGGAPELHPQFRELVSAARTRNVHVIDRCNLTVLLEPDQSDTAAFLAQQKVEIVASLPCYLESNVDEQRGDGVFQKSVEALHLLNKLGYGMLNSSLTLNLVYNPIGAYLPSAQENLEIDYKRELQARYNIHFNHLFALTNMPIARFGSTLVTQGKFEEYMTLLKNAYQASNLDNLMCRSLISIDYQGYVYDCDFNQMLGIGLGASNKLRTHIRELLDHNLNDTPIAIADHCYGCTAGQGSSCGGAL